MASRKDDRLQMALQASKEGIWDWDLVVGTIYYSPRVYRFMGYRKEEMPNLFDERKEHMDEDSAEAVSEALRRVTQEGEDLFAVEPRVRTQKGVWKWFRVRGTPVRDDLGKVIRIAGSLIDISKRKEAERELAEERHLIKTLLDRIPMNLYFKDEESRFVMANLATATKMGFASPDELIGKSDADFFSEEHAGPAREDEVRIMKTGEGILDLTEHEKWDDRPDTWVKSTKHAWVDQDGEVRGTFGVTSDISELMRTRAEQEAVTAQLDEQNNLIEQERQQMRLVIDNVPLNVYFKNKDHQFLLANRAIAEWFDFDRPEDLYDLTDRDIFSEEHWSKAEADEDRIMKSGEPMVGKVERETWGGKSDTWVLTSKYPWRDSRGEIVGTFGVSSDISDLMRAQRRSEDLAATFEQKNREIAEELALAREVQQALLPEEFPTIKAEKGTLEFHRFYRPARDLTGEFFEVLPLGGKRVGFLICEVVEEGVRAALIVSMLRGLVEKQRSQADDAGDFLTGLNEGMSHLLIDSDLEIRATAFYGVVDMEKGEIQLSHAGHVKPIAVFDDGVRQVVPPPEASGPALGVAKGTKYGAVVAPLGGLRRMMCFTTGLREARNPEGKEFGVTRLLETIERGGEINSVMERVAKTVADFGEGDEFRKAICMLGWEITR